MAIRRSRSTSSVIVRGGEPLIGLFVEENGNQAVRYFTSAEAADEAVSAGVTQDALALAGAWRDLDWETLASELDRIRHQSPPSPPISL